MADTVRLQIPIDPKLHKEFKLASVEDGFDMSQKVRDLVADFLEKRKQGKTKK